MGGEQQRRSARGASLPCLVLTDPGSDVFLSLCIWKRIIKDVRRSQSEDGTVVKNSTLFTFIICVQGCAWWMIFVIIGVCA